jgi:hypothetical protein
LKSDKRSRAVWITIGICVLLVIAVLAVIGEVLVHKAGPILRGRVIETLSTRFDSRVELDELSVSVVRGIDVSGRGLRVFPPDDMVAAGATQPLIAVGRFSFHAGLIGLFIKPTHVHTVHVTNMQINIPPREMRQQGVKWRKYGGKVKIKVNEIVVDDSRLIIGTAKPNKDPKNFELRHIVLRDLGPNGPSPYEATLVNAVPQGSIHAVGTFGPWDTESPGASTVTGRYTFDHADLNTIKGIGGVLSSVGEFKGRLDRIEVEGTTSVPDFSLDSANHPMQLFTRYHAIVDGTNGDTYLEPVEAKLGQTEFTCRGAVTNVKGKGHFIDLDVDVPAGRLEDFLQLAVKTQPVVMTGVIRTKSRLNIQPGEERVLRKLQIKGEFELNQIRFTNPAVQDKVDMLTLRARGKPKEAKPGAEDVNSRMTGVFTMAREKLEFRNLRYTLPGATVTLTGVYSVDGKQFNFYGKVRTQATLSQMVASRWKSWMLKAVDPFFKKNGAGAEIPVKVTGTNNAPKFGLALRDSNKR